MAVSDFDHNVLQIALRIDPVQLRRLCRTPNYAERRSYS